ncbi:hypothetical protein pdam_00013900 [Pocillopora damicornis]|uniref:Uncharacterized protein n=1 Tax=Pocillopora damicornis TaxID=46731 RepID=A0A3M6UC32_POCDA|nr:hypothetical protein pdam_00013900 [Pocillopora damicornis]
MEVEIPTEETEPLLRQEITSSLQRPEDVYNNSVQNTAFDVHGDAIDERPRGRYQSQEWMRGLSKIQHRAVNVGLFTGLLLVSWVPFVDVCYQDQFDLDHIKKALTYKCQNKKACNGVWYPLVTSIYWGMYSSIAVCCVFFSLCLSMTNDLAKGYLRLAKCTGNVRDAVIMHKQLVVFLASIFDWWEAERDSLHSVVQYLAQISGTLVVVYKFFFPFLSASYVTRHESTLVQDLNDKTDYLPGETFHSRQDLEVFLAQSKRRVVRWMTNQAGKIVKSLFFEDYRINQSPPLIPFMT